MRRFLRLRGNTAAAVIAASTLLATFVSSACNLVTGADGLMLRADNEGDDDDNTGSSSSSSNGSSSSGTGGSSSSSSSTSSSSSSTGSSTSSGTGGASSSSSSSTSSTSSSSSGTGGSSSSSTSSSSSGTGAGPTDCDYPDGPYGVDQGQTVPPTLSWQGYAPNSNAVSTITSEDFFDCDGTKGIDAVLVDTSQFG